MVELGHEKLRVYRQALDHATWMQGMLPGIDSSAAVSDQWVRAAESIVENLANGNSRRSRANRNRYFDYAIGSALECAACLDICRCREMMTSAQVEDGKQTLCAIVSMTIRLREAASAYVREDTEPYSEKPSVVYFDHEKLDAYRSALDLVVWLHGFLTRSKLGALHLKRLDACSTSLVLNIAEGNGRFGEADRARFLDIAHTSAMRIAACLDLLVARSQITSHDIDEGKSILARVVPLVLGLRAYHHASDPDPDRTPDHNLPNPPQV